MSAQQLRVETKEQAEREAQLILREAHSEGERILDVARSEARRIAGELEAMDRSRRSYLAQMRAMVERQLAEIDASSSAPPPQLPSSGNSDEARKHHHTPVWLDTLVKE